jgi:hypothetical protein
MTPSEMAKLGAEKVTMRCPRCSAPMTLEARIVAQWIGRLESWPGCAECFPYDSPQGDA